MGQSEDRVLELLLEASSGVVPAAGREPWDYGWALEDYRRSSGAALTGSNGPVSLNPDALASWEAGLKLLATEAPIRRRWDTEELGGLVASLTVAVSEEPSTSSRRERLTSSLEALRSGGPAFVLQLVSNVSWTGAPIQLGDAIVGPVGDPLFDMAEAVAAGRCVIGLDARRNWSAAIATPRVVELGTPPVALACWTVGLNRRGLAEAGRTVRDVVDLPLMLERDLRRHRISGLVDVNRPGVRGLSLDRGAVEHVLRDSPLSIELLAFPLVENGVAFDSSRVSWHGLDPLPLGQLLEQPYLRDAVERCLCESPIARRLRVAARWFSEAHYASARDDAALALGVCLDALLGGERALPGSAMSDRAALLVREPSQRREAKKSHAHFYGVRSAVAHGGRSSKLTSDALSAGFQLAHLTAWRLLDFEDIFTPKSDSQVDEIFDDLRLGIAAWPLTI